jgi:preprotein translocase subunit YajC
MELEQTDRTGLRSFRLSQKKKKRKEKKKERLSSIGRGDKSMR